ATFFATHDTPVLEELRAVNTIEIGIHPNFNPLLREDGQKGRTAQSVLDDILTIVPEAKAVRSHSVVQSSFLWDMFAKAGLTHECNDFIHHASQMQLKPWHVWNGLIKAPYFWEDDVACLYGEGFSTQSCLNREGLKIFDFHPIHVYLNTETLDRYENSRASHRDPGSLLQFRNTDQKGTRDALLELLESTP
ncbi:MAG: hypothetical protein R3D66_01195, partial [Alphaproteobacteria bacterium]